ncbi:MAG: radical SAM protein [Christensenellaceae bacterium]|jgi:DNA repair photolyase
MEFVPAKTIVNRTKNDKWFGADYNMNIYRGCCHGCIYCDSRSECYGVENFDTVKAKADALAIIERELRSKRSKGVVGTGAMSDPYNPFESKYGYTRKALELINKHWFGVAIDTKSDLVTRDIDLLKQIGEHSPVLVKITVTAADDALAQKVEPHAPPSSRRFAAIEALSRNGIDAGVLMMPLLPFIEDSEENVLGIIRKARDAGAKFVYPGFGMTLRQNQRGHYLSSIEALFPGMRQKYQKQFGYAYSCNAMNAKKLYAYFKEECKKHGLLHRMRDIIDLYKAPYMQRQLKMF